MRKINWLRLALLSFLCLFVAKSFNLAFETNTNSKLNYYYKNGVVYVYGYDYLVSYIYPDFKDTVGTVFIKEFNSITFAPIRELIFDNHSTNFSTAISNFTVDDNGNKYFVRDDGSSYSKIKGDANSATESIIVQKYNNLTNQKEFALKIPGLYSASLRILNDSLYIFGKTVNPANCLIGINPFQNIDSSIDDDKSTIYSAVINLQDSSLIHSTFISSIGSDYLIDNIMHPDNSILTLGYVSRKFLKDTLGGFPTTQTAFQTKLPDDSLNKIITSQNDIFKYTLSKLSSDMSKLEFGSYYTYGNISQVSLDGDDIIVTGWNRTNSKSLDAGSFIYRFDKDFSKILNYRTFSKLDTLDTLYFDTPLEHNPDLDPSFIRYGFVNLRNDRDYKHFINSKGEIIVVGTTSDPNHPVTADAFQKTLAGKTDIIVYKLNKNFDILYCSYLGTDSADYCRQIFNTETAENPNEFLISIESNSAQTISGIQNLKLKPNNPNPITPSNQYLAKFVIGKSAKVDEQKSKYSLFPNPASEFINIDEAMLNGDNNIEIYNALGMKVMEEVSTSRINISTLSAGVYTVKCGDKVKSFIKQ